MNQHILPGEVKECEDDTGTGYLSISIPLHEPFPPEQEKLLEAISKKIPKRDCYFSKTEAALIFYYNSVDIDKLKNIIEKFYKDTTPGIINACTREKNIFDEIIEHVETNGSYGIKGRKRLYVGYNNERKVKDRKVQVKKRSSYFYALDNNFTKEVNEIPKEFENRIFCADSEELLKKLPDNCVDLVFTSPPYNFGLGYDTGEDGQHWELYFKKLFAIFDECIRVLKYGGRIIVNVQPLFSDYIPSHQIIANHFMERKLIWKGEIIWEKNNYNCKYTAWGSWKSPSGPYLKYTWEFLEVFSKGDLLKPGLRENIDITGDEFKKWVVAKWSIGPDRNMKKYDHPAMFPEELVERALKLFSYQHDVILDPFNGAGTTTAVAKRLKRRYLGIDISEVYCKKSELRLKELLDSYVSL